jgi:hypothetical protein
MPIKSGSSPAVVSSNISEFHKGPTFQKTADKFGKDRANKQAVAVALHSADKSKDGKGEDHKSAVAKMHPEHVHKLVQDAHAGKYGPQAQQVAQMATQPQQGATVPPQGDGDADDTGGSVPSSMFSSGGASPAAAAPPPPASRASMFQGR